MCFGCNLLSGKICQFDCCVQCRNVPFVPQVVTFSPPGLCNIVVTFDNGRRPERIQTDSSGQFDVKQFGRTGCSFQPMSLTEPSFPLGSTFRLQLPLVKEETREVEACVAKPYFKHRDQPMSGCEATGIFRHADGTMSTFSEHTDTQGCLPLLLPHGCITECRALTSVIAVNGRDRVQVVVPIERPLVVPPRAAGSNAKSATYTCTAAKESSRIEFLNFCKGNRIIILADVSGSMAGQKLQVLKRTLVKALDEVPNPRQSIAIQAWSTSTEWFRSKRPSQPSIPSASSIPHELCDMILGRAGDLYQDPVMAADGWIYERSRIESWLARNATSPKDKTPLSDKKLIPSKQMQERVAAFLAQQAPAAPTRATSTHSSAAANSAAALWLRETDKKDALEWIERLTDQDSTRLGPALEEATGLDGATDIVILCDGKFETFDFNSLRRRFPKILFHCVAIGSDADQDAMLKIAWHNGGEKGHFQHEQ